MIGGKMAKEETSEEKPKKKGKIFGDPVVVIQ